MNLKNQLITTLIASACITSTALYAEDYQPEAPKATNVKSVAKKVNHQKAIKDEITFYIEEQYDWLNENGVNPDDVNFYQGVQAIHSTKNDADWAARRVLAIDKAIHEAREEYLNGMLEEFGNETITEFFDHSDLPAPTAADFEQEGRFERLIKKSLMVADAYLSQHLKEFGIELNEFRELPPHRQEAIMRDTFTNKSILKAAGDLSGLFVEQVFEVYDENSGKGAVGVVMSLSPSKRDLIQDMIANEGDAMPDPSKANPEMENMRRYFREQEMPMLHFGIQGMRDSNGYPMLVAYGQWGVKYTENARQLDRARKKAESFATNKAWEALASAINLNGNLRSETSVREFSETNRMTQLLGPDTAKTTESSVEGAFAELINESSKTTSNIKNLKGVRTIYEWQETHPVTGHETVGVVMVWHPKTAKTFTEIQQGKRANQMTSSADKEPSQQEPRVEKSTPIYRTGGNINVHDF